jgi:hypothetical protein
MHNVRMAVNLPELDFRLSKTVSMSALAIFAAANLGPENLNLAVA